MNKCIEFQLEDGHILYVSVQQPNGTTILHLKLLFHDQKVCQ